MWSLTESSRMRDMWKVERERGPSMQRAEHEQSTNSKGVSTENWKKQWRDHSGCPYQEEV